MYRVGGSTGVFGLSTFRENVRLSVQQNVICLIRDRIRMPPSSCYTTYGDFTQWAASDWVVGRTHSWLNRSDVERLNRNLSAAPTRGVDNRFTAAFLPFSSMRAPCTAGPSWSSRSSNLDDGCSQPTVVRESRQTRPRRPATQIGRRADGPPAVCGEGTGARTQRQLRPRRAALTHIFGKYVRRPCERLTCISDVLPRDPKYCRFLLRRWDR